MLGVMAVVDFYVFVICWFMFWNFNLDCKEINDMSVNMFIIIGTSSLIKCGDINRTLEINWFQTRKNKQNLIFIHINQQIINPLA